MNDYLKQLEGAAGAVAFHPPDRFSWFGLMSPGLPPKLRRALTPEAVRGYLLHMLQMQLYRDFYCRGAATPFTEQPGVTGASGASILARELQAANTGQGFWDKGWVVLGSEPGGIVAYNGEFRLWVLPHQYQAIGPDVVAGQEVHVNFSKDLPAISPGYYMAIGDVALTRAEHDSLVRLYWNVDTAGALKLVGRSTRLLNDTGLPFKLKVVSNPGDFNRCDTAVLYIRKGDFPQVKPILGEIYREVTDNLRPAVPALTKGLGLGLAVAEDPGGGVSYGLHRCVLLADALLSAHAGGKQSPADRLAHLVEIFTGAGIALDAPYLNPGSADIYQADLPVQTHQTPQAGRDVAPNRPGQLSLAEVAETVGRRLAKQAVWHKDRCNWVGAVNREQSGRPTANATYAALGPELYAGTSGVALFLAELWSVTGEATARITALGAISQALDRIDAAQQRGDAGLYTGSLGVAVAAARVGKLLGAEEVLARGHAIARRYRVQPDVTSHDLLAGQAGSIVGLLVLMDAYNEPTWLDHARELGNNLLQSADRSGVGYSWRTHGGPSVRNLTGLAHGAAGIGWSLLELYQSTGDDRYKKVAESAFDYERHWFDLEAGNWPDFRFAARRGRSQSKTHFPSVAFWCHGAPGIGLTRLRAYQLLEDERYRAEAEVALDTTVGALNAMLRTGIRDFSLCHGAAGLADIASDLSSGRHEVDQTIPDTVLEIAETGARRYALGEGGWPCGAGGRETQGLMLGLAGIGLFYLRMSNPDVVSALLFKRGV